MSKQLTLSANRLIFINFSKFHHHFAKRCKKDRTNKEL